MALGDNHLEISAELGELQHIQATRFLPIINLASFQVKQFVHKQEKMGSEEHLQLMAIKNNSLYLIQSTLAEINKVIVLITIRTMLLISVLRIANKV